MNTKTTCSHLTRRGRPCRNPAAPGSDPPACARHRDRPASPSQPPARAMSLGAEAAGGPIAAPPAGAPAHFYFPHPTAADLPVLAATAPETGLRPEVDLVRVVLRRLLAHLDEAAGQLPPEELRRISGLVFTGARTVAMLIDKQAARPAGLDDWLDTALREIGERYEREL